MTPRTLKEVAQAGLVLGFEWIAMDENESLWVFNYKPMYDCGDWVEAFTGGSAFAKIYITDYPDLPPERSLLRLRDIVEGKV